MDTQEIRKQLSRLDDLNNRKTELQGAIADLDFRGHQRRLYAKMGETGVEVSTLNSSTGYASRVKRGYEMVHLGLQKVFNGALDEINTKIQEQERLIAKYIEGHKNV